MARTPVRIGAWATQSPSIAIERWSPTLAYLNKKISTHSFELLPLGYEELVSAVKNGAVDFFIADPALCVQLGDTCDIDTIATAQSSFEGRFFNLLGGTLLCRADREDLAKPADLKNRSIASVDPRALKDWLSVAREFRNAGLRPTSDLNTTFVGNEDAVIAAVLEGRADAGAVRAGALERALATQRIQPGQLRVLTFENIHGRNSFARIPLKSSTRLYPGWSFAACQKAAPDLVKRVASALLRMPHGNGDPGPRVSGWTCPRSDFEVHDCLRDLRMYPYENYGEVTIVQIVRQYMYWFIAAGALFIILIVIDIYVTALNRALTAEIAERRRAESALRESVMRFEHVATCSSDWIWETDRECRYTYSNTIVHQMLGYRPDEVIGRQPVDLFAMAEKDRVKAENLVVPGTGARLFRARFRMRTKDGRVVIHESTADPVRNAQGDLTGYRGVNRDITEQVRFVKLR